MNARQRRTAGLFGFGLGITISGVAWATWPGDAVDPSYEPRVREPAFSGRSRPEVLIDEAHYNLHTASGTYAPFAQLLRRDGYRVRRSNTALSRTALQSEARGPIVPRILVVANALGWRGVFGRLLGRGPLERARRSWSAFSAAEIAEVEAWVREGGALLLVADDAAAGHSASALAAAFGVEMTDWRAEDAQHQAPATGTSTFLVFSRSNGLLLDHPITLGRDPIEQIQRVIALTGQALRPLRGAAPLLTFSRTATPSPRSSMRQSEPQTAAALAQALAVQHGRGRVVMLGDAAMLTAQSPRAPDGTAQQSGINRRDADNEQFVLNILHWLSGLL